MRALLLLPLVIECAAGCTTTSTYWISEADYRRLTQGSQGPVSNAEPILAERDEGGTDVYVRASTITGPVLPIPPPRRKLRAVQATAVNGALTASGILAGVGAGFLLGGGTLYQSSVDAEAACRGQIFCGLSTIGGELAGGALIGLGVASLTGALIAGIAGAGARPMEMKVERGDRWRGPEPCIPEEGEPR